MTDLFVHLDQKETRKQRRKQLENDAEVLFDEHITQLKEQGLTELSPDEAFASAVFFARVFLSLPEEGIDDVFEYLKEDAEGENDAKIISVLAACHICDQRGSLPEAVWKFLATHIFARCDGHELLWSMLQEAARRWPRRLMEDKTNLLMCEMNETHLDGARAVVFDIVENCMGLTAESIEKILLPLRALKDKYGNTFDEQINRLQEKLNEKTTTQTTTQVNVGAGGTNMQYVENYNK